MQVRDCLPVVRRGSQLYELRDERCRQHLMLCQAGQNSQQELPVPLVSYCSQFSCGVPQYLSRSAQEEATVERSIQYTKGNWCSPRDLTRSR